MWDVLKLIALLFLFGGLGVLVLLGADLLSLSSFHFG